MHNKHTAGCERHQGNPAYPRRRLLRHGDAHLPPPLPLMPPPPTHKLPCMAPLRPVLRNHSSWWTTWPGDISGRTTWVVAGKRAKPTAMAEADLTDFADDALKFDTYEQYLDSQVRDE
eukprot:107001-Hanusia_phi.AAC.4